jgi:hypothetical protein
MDDVIGDDRTPGPTNPDTDTTMAAHRSVADAVAEHYVLPDIRTAADVDGTVTKLVVSNDVAHLYLRDHRGRNLKFLVSDMDLAQRLAEHVENDPIRIVAEGYWQRTRRGWLPKYGECNARSFVTLDRTGIVELLDRFTALASRGWNAHENPIAAWKALRGCA